MASQRWPIWELNMIIGRYSLDPWAAALIFFLLAVIAAGIYRELCH